ncbi:unnamed protein product, partial [Callosobruchus maculatus]
MCTFIYFSRNGSNRIGMFSEHMAIKSLLTFESHITMNACAKVISIYCFWM